MKRIVLSCLTVLCMLSLGFVANAQVNPSAPTIPGSSPATPATPVANGVKHIYICNGEKRPVDLTYDVLGVHLDVNRGTWIASHPTAAKLGTQYDGQNVFRVTASDPGTYVFDFVTFGGTYCNVPDGHYFRAFVHIMPDFTNPQKARYIICEKDLPSGLSEDPLQHIPASIKAIVENAGFELKLVTSGTTFTGINNSSLTPAIYSYEADLKLVNKGTGTDVNATNNPGFTCPTTFKLRVELEVTKDMDASVDPDQSLVYCLGQTGTLSTDPKVIFNRAYVLPADGTYAPAAINWSAFTPGGPALEFVYTFKDCDNQTKTRRDSILVQPDGVLYDAPSALYDLCKPDEGANLGLSLAYDNADTYRPNVFHPTLSNLAVSWKFHGTSAAGGTSLPDPSTFEPGKTLPSGVKVSDLVTSTPYYYIFTINASGPDCLAGQSDTLIIEAKDGTTLGDGRMQICYNTTADVIYNLSELMNLNPAITAWDYDPQTAISPVFEADAIKHRVKVLKDAAPSTHRYKYAQSGSSACDQSTGVFYLTIAEKAIVSNDIIEKFCRATLPKSVNLDYLLGANMPGSWAVKTNDFETAVPIASYITGGKVLDIAKYSEATYSKGDGTIVFEFTPGPGACITGAHTVTIKLTNDLTL